MENENSVSVPEDMVVEIFKRLPAKSLMRFKCLSKKYASIIQNQNFVESFYTHASTKRPSFLFSICINNKYMLYSAKPHTSAEAHHAITINESSFIITTPPVRGLICYSIGDNQHVICNPSTNQIFHLPQNESWKVKYFEDVFFGYEPISNRFKVVCILHDLNIEYQFWMFTVGDGNSWRKIEDVPYPYRPVDDMYTLRVCINGVLYYKVYSNVDMKRVVVSFDLKSEKFNLFKLPLDVLTEPKLIEFQGKLAFIDHTTCDICVWVLEKNEWSKMYKLSWTIPVPLRDLSRHMVAGIWDGEIVFVPSRLYPFVTQNFNLEKKTFSSVHIPIPLNGVCHYNYECFPNYFENIVLLQ